MPSNIAPSAVSDLAALVTGNALTSQYADYAERQQRQGTFYKRLLAEQGKAAAEASLTSLNQRDRTSDFAEAVAPVVKALHALWQVNPDSVQVRDVQQGSFYPIFREITNANKIFVAFNQVPPKQQVLPGVADWGPSGHLGLKAVTLQAGLDSEFRIVGELGLVMALRGNEYEHPKDGYLFVGVAATGQTRTVSFEPRLRRDGYLMYQLGLIPAERAISCTRGGGGMSDAELGFPGARDYLANCLPDLAKYFTALAAAQQQEPKE